jgi:hypothetical protein
MIWFADTTRWSNIQAETKRCFGFFDRKRLMFRVIHSASDSENNVAVWWRRLILLVIVRVHLTFFQVNFHRNFFMMTNNILQLFKLQNLECIVSKSRVWFSIWFWNLLFSIYQLNQIFSNKRGSDQRWWCSGWWEY